MVFIWDFFDEYYDEALVHEFDRMEGKKIALLHRKGINITHSAILDLDLEDGTRAMSISPVGLLGKRYLDQFDYVSFINQ